MTALQGKTAVVTGAAGGIGLAIAGAMARAGASVVIADLSERGADSAAGLRAQGYRAQFVQADLCREAEADKLAAQAAGAFGGIDILVNNVGIYPRAGLLDTTEELWDRVMTINVKSMYLCCRAIVPYMAERGGGSIVNIGSSHAEIGLPELFAYSVSKGAVLTLTRNLAGALAGKRIRVNCVNPGWVATEKELAERAANGQTLDDLRAIGAQLPLGRMQEGEDTAAVAVFLSSDAASQITGQFIHVDGGKSVAMAFDDRSLERD